MSQSKIFKQSLKGGEPKIFAELKGDNFFDFDWSPNGKNFAFTRGAWKHDISLVKDFRKAIIHR